MREIKFRAWHKSWSTEINSEGWRRPGAKSPYRNGMQVVEGLHDSKRGRSVKLHDWADYTRLNEDIVLMQYTGLKDKNGKEMYDGDIVKILNDDIYFIEWDKNLAAWVLNGDHVKKVGGHLGNYWQHLIPTIVGNIYENPELLGVTE